MLDNKDYISRLNRARRRRNRRLNISYMIIGLIAAVVIGLLIGAGIFMMKKKEPASSDNQKAVQEEQMAETESSAEESPLSLEEAAENERLAEAEKVVDSYENLGIVQVSGYLNIRETPGADGKIIGKLEGDSACEIVSSEGDWYQITSGGLTGYISNAYVLTGEEAREKALGLVKKMALITGDSVNIRQEPVIDPANVIGAAIKDERYAVEEELDGWIKIPEGYISSDYAQVQYMLNEAQKLDLQAMAINQYNNLVISKVDTYLNVREEPSPDGKIIGKMTSKAAGEILDDSTEGWYKIKSGKITGYISSDPQYTATGQEAKDIATGTATLMAIVNTDMLNVRTEPSTDASIWTQISKEERYPVLNQLDGWVEIELDAGDEEGSVDKAYVSTRDNNVEVRYALNEAIKFSPLEEAANASASLRNQIVNYALQFVGNPYVWGGTSLTNGVDCSGFTMKVYEKFGVALPHYSGSQAQMGKAVSSSEMRPADLIFYTDSKGKVNHVAMYIGNGQVVHAASRRSGIKISTWNYRKPKTIRNMLGD
ncbi:MAG: SH3 domain-containing protein [Lachnospiraceae bacterium]